MVLHAVLFLVVVGVEAAVVVQGFAIHGPPVGPGFLDGGQPFPGADVDEIDRRPGPFRYPQHPPEGNVLRLVAVDQVHVPPLGLLPFRQLAVHVLHHVVVLGVDHQHGAMPLHLLHQVVHVAGAHHAGFPGHAGGPDVGGENLDAGETVLDVLAHLPQDVVGNVAQQHQVVGVVGVGVALPDAGPFLDGLADVDAGELDGKVQDGGGAAEEGRPAHLLRGRRFQVALAHDGSIDVGVGFNAAGHHHLAGGVNDPGRLFGEGVVGGHGDNLLALNGNVPVAHSPGRNHLSVADNQVKHTCPPVVILSTNERE